MALGLLFRVFWICVLLFGGSAGLPAIKGYGYPYQVDTYNLGDDINDETLNSDQVEWEDSSGQAYGHAYTSYWERILPKQPQSLPSRGLTNTPSLPKVERLVNGNTRDWGQDQLDKPITFPLGPSYQPGGLKFQSGSTLSQLQPSPSSGVSSSVEFAPSTGSSSGYDGFTAYSDPNQYSTSPQYISSNKSPSFETLKPEPVSSSSYVGTDSSFGTNNQPFNVDSTEGGTPRQIYEEVFQYPASQSDNVGGSDLSYQGYGGDSGLDVGHQPSDAFHGYNPTVEEPALQYYSTYWEEQPEVYSPEVESPDSPDFPIGDEYGYLSPAEATIFYQPSHGKTPSKLPEPVPSTEDFEKQPQHVSEPLVPPAPKSSLIVQTSNGYQRGRVVFSKTSYTPVIPQPIILVSGGVRKSAPHKLISAPFAGSKPISAPVASSKRISTPFAGSKWMKTIKG